MAVQNLKAYSKRNVRGGASSCSSYRHDHPSSMVLLSGLTVPILFASLTGSSSGSTALLGSVLVPEMEKRGYKKPMSLGPILGSGGLAIMIPPSGLAILLAAIAEISIGKLLMAIIMPGLLMAAFYATYIIFRCKLQPYIAPAYEIASISLSQKLIATARCILPVGIVLFAVTGVIFLGIATPSEAAATGTLGSLILAALYGKLNWTMFKKATMGTISITVMIFMIMVGAKIFSQILVFSGATIGLVEFATGLPVAPIVLIIVMQIVIMIMGMFLSVSAIIMICAPVFMPIVLTMGFNPVWFGTIFLLNIEMAMTTPPYGTSLFVMKSVAPPDTTMGDVVRAALPFIYCDAVAIALIIAFPGIALWLPGLMR